MPYHQRSTAFRSVLGLDTRSNSGVALATAQNVIEWTVINKHPNQDLPRSFNATKTCIGMHQHLVVHIAQVHNLPFTLFPLKRVRLYKSKNLKCLNFNPFTPEISLLILLTVCYTILMMLVQRIWY